MRAEKIGILIEQDDRGRYNLHVVGVNGDRVVSNISELEERGVSLNTICRKFELAWQTLRLRISKRSVEFLKKGDADE